MMSEMRSPFRWQKAVKRSYPVGNRPAYHKNLQYPPGMEKALPCPTAVSRSGDLLNSVNRSVRTYGFGHALKYAGKNHNIFRRK